MEFMLRKPYFKVLFTDNFAKNSAVIGAHQAKIEVAMDDIYAASAGPLVDGDGTVIGAQLHVIMYEAKMFRKNTQMRPDPTHGQWEALRSRTRCTLLPVDLRDKVHVVLDFAGEDAEKQVVGLVAVMHQHWPHLKSVAPLNIHTATQPELNEDTRRADMDAGAASRRLDLSHANLGSKRKLVHMQLRRLRNVVVCSHSETPCALALSDCVCLIANDDECYRANSCWACQFRILCSACLEELVPAGRDSSVNTGSPVSLERELQRLGGDQTDSVLHAWCPDCDEPHQVFKTFMADTGRWTEEWRDYEY